MQHITFEGKCSSLASRPMMNALTLVRDRTCCILGESRPFAAREIRGASCMHHMKLLSAHLIGWDYLITCLPGSPAC